MKTVSIVIIIIAIGILAASIIGFLKIKNELKSTMVCHDMRYTVISGLYVVLLLFFIAAYIAYILIYAGQSECGTASLLITALLFFGSIFVGVSTLFLQEFINSVFEMKKNQTDAMTGLMTKKAIELSAQKLLGGNEGNHVLTVLDLDNFKAINDIYGHAMGDEVICMVAGILQDTVRANDMVGRFGGDEFLVLFQHMHIEQAQRIMKRVEISVISMLQDKGCTVCTGISYGAAELKGGSGTSYRQLFEQADRALYQMKKDKQDIRKNEAGKKR